MDDIIRAAPKTVVQINPGYDPAFGGALMVVTETKDWGVIGYVTMPGRPTSSLAYYRCKHEGYIPLFAEVVWFDSRNDQDD